MRVLKTGLMGARVSESTQNSASNTSRLSAFNQIFDQSIQENHANELCICRAVAMAAIVGEADPAELVSALPASHMVAPAALLDAHVALGACACMRHDPVHTA
jgi:hypothetical protein